MGLLNHNLQETLATNNNGKSWLPAAITDKKIEPANYLWSAEIYCSIMTTTDGGSSWYHICKNHKNIFVWFILKITTLVGR